MVVEHGGWRAAKDLRTEVRTPFDWCLAQLPGELPGLVSSLRDGGGDLRERLHRSLSSEIVKEAFNLAIDDDEWPYALPREIIFPQSLWPISLLLRSGPLQRQLQIPNQALLATVRQALSGDWMSTPPDAPSRGLAAALLKDGLLQPDAGTAALRPKPGLYRLQHASTLVVTQQATIIIDPVSDLTTNSWPDPADLPLVDAILISHAHNDHFSLTTLMRFRRDVTIIVPRIPRPSMLSPPMAEYLRAAGFERVLEPKWGESVAIKDALIHISPFLGEQPWVTFPSPEPDLRNWGNTYVVEAMERRIWFLIDAGQEAGGSMVEVAEQLAERFGSIDVVLSNLRTFPWHPRQIDNSGRFLFCFPKHLLENPDQWPDGQPITLGPVGVAKVLKACKAVAFLPYAHWFHPPGTKIDVDGRAPESALVYQVEAAAERLGSHPVICRNWSIGDGFSFSDEGDDWALQSIWKEQ